MRLNKKRLKDTLDSYFLDALGYRKVNGGFVEASITKITKTKDDIYQVFGTLKSGIEDCGSSTIYKDNLEDLYVEVKNRKFRILDEVEVHTLIEDE